MPKKFLPWFKIFTHTSIFISYGMVFIPICLASGYFDDKDLDFWNEGKKVKSFSTTPPVQDKQKELRNTAVNSRSIIRQSDTLPFDWKNYEDPKSVEFWDDGGDYIAPRPLREAMVNPSEENLAKYLTWQAKRLEVLAVFNAKLVQTDVSKAKKSSPQNVSMQSSVRLKEVELLYFYQTACPHCQAEKDHVEKLARQGVRVSFIQLDSDVNPPLHAGSIPYTARHSAQFAITATPTWILRRREKTLRLQGEQAQVEMEIAKLFATGSG